MGDSPQHASKRDISYASRQSDRARGWATTTEQS